jgi:hypothetical protein
VQSSASSITRSFEAQSNLTIFSVVDAISSEEVIPQIVSFLTAEPTQLVLWDCAAGSIAHMAPKDLQSIVDRGKPFAESRRGGRTAIVCATDLDYGLCRVFRAYAEISHVPFEIEVFRNRDAAKEWLQEREVR